MRNQCKVTTHFRKARQLVEFRHFTECHFSQNQLENEDRTVQTQGFRQFRVNGADETDFTPFALNARGLTRVQRRVFARSEGERIQCTGEAQHRFHVSLDVEEINRVATLRPTFRQPATANHAGQHRLLLQAFELTDEAQTAFEQTHAILLTVEVVLQRFDQTWPQRRAHCRHVIGDRIGQQQRLDARVEQFELTRIDEAVSDRFLITTRHQQTAQLRQIAARFSLGLRCQACLRVTNRQTVVAVQAGQLFDQIDFQADVETMAWHFYAPLTFTVGSNAKTQTAEQTLDLRGIHFHTEHLGDALGTQSDRRDRRQMLLADGLDDRAGFAASNVQQQASGALHGFTGQLPVNATLVAVRRIGVQAVGTSLARHSDLVEERTFQEYIASGRGDTTVLTTHHTGNRQRAGVVGNHQRIATQADFLTVEQYQLLALLRHAHTDAAIDFGEIESVQWLTQFEHHVVGDVDGSVDAAHVSATQTLHHPQRRRLGQVNVTDNAAQVTWARGRRQHFYRTHFIVHGRNGHDHWTGHWCVVQRANFTGQTG
ncbi:hypothetical protein D3C84_514420 [compost metagenome]